MQVVSYGAVTIDGVRQSNFYYQYPLADSWGLAEVVLEIRDAGPLVAGVHFYKSERPWTEMHAVTFAEKSVVHHLMFAAVIFNPLFILFALVQCVRTPIPRRKWLWIIFILVGVTEFQFNWTTGETGYKLLNLSLLAAGFAKMSPISPLILKVGVPLGAIVFLLERSRWLRPPPANAPIST
jgi:hypothetical protein